MLIPALLSATALWLAAPGPTPAAGPDLIAGAAEVLHFSFESEEEDRDYDGQPDDWTRRKGAGFPAYVDVQIDREQGFDARQSLRFTLDGGQAALYSPPVPIDPLHAYVFRGAIRTEGLAHDAALVSISLLNHRRQRVARVLTRPVSGTHADWVTIRLGPILPTADVRFLVIGCHVVSGRKQDIRGAAWFDDLRVGRLPRMSLVSNVHTHFVRRSLPVRIEARVSGLEDRSADAAMEPPESATATVSKARLRLTLHDSADRVVAEEAFPLSTSATPNPLAPEPDGPQLIVWSLPPQEYGFYRVVAALERNGAVILDEEMTFAVTDHVETVPSGEFGWSAEGGARELPLAEFAEVAAQAGIHWLKFPLWQSVMAGNSGEAVDIAEMLERLRMRHVTAVGLLSDPPPAIRRKFARDWSGISEVFALPPSFWSGSLDPVIARFSSQVQYWQLGGDGDSSFVGMASLTETLAGVKREFDRIGRNTQIGLHWELDTPLPIGGRPPGAFVSLSDDRTLSDEELRQRVTEQSIGMASRWLTLKPLARSKHTPEDRGADLVRRMVAAKISGANAIFAWDVFDPEHGLLNADGSPTLLFLPWRTTALALREAEFIGSLDLPGGSRNYAFARGDEVVLIVWNTKPAIEEFYLGEPDTVSATDIWGVRRRVPVRTLDRHTVQSFEVGPTPLVIRGCSEPVARWRMAVQFEKGRIPSATGGHPEVILGYNTFGQGVSGEVSLNVPREWETEPRSWKFGLAPREEFRLPLVLSLPSAATLGEERTSIDFVVDADRQYRFRVYRPYQVGLGDIEIDVFDRRLPDGTLEIEQVITNNTDPEEVLNLECSLFVPGQKRQIKSVTKLGRGINRKLYYVPRADALRGQELWIRAAQRDGRRVLNKRWIVGETWTP